MVAQQVLVLFVQVRILVIQHERALQTMFVGLFRCWCSIEKGKIISFCHLGAIGRKNLDDIKGVSEIFRFALDDKLLFDTSSL